MRIVIDATAAVSGGRLYLEKLIGQLAKSGTPHEFLIIHAGDLDQLAATCHGQHFSFYRLDLLAGLRIPVIPPGLWRMLWRRFFLPRLMERFNADLLFSNSGFAPSSKSRGYRVLIALHNLMPLREELIAEERSWLLRRRLIWLRRMIHRSLKNCDGAIVFSNDTARTIREKLPDVSITPKVIYHGLDWPAGKSEVEAPPPVGFKRPYLLFVSQFHRYKNLVRLLEAFARVADANPELTLVLIGEKADPAYWSEVEAAIDRLKIGDRIVCRDACPREELPGIYRHALAFVHPSLAETFSFPLLEAMACGLPVAAARMSALPEIAGEGALYFDPYDVPAMAEVLKLLVDNPDLRADLAARAAQRATFFTWQRTAALTVAAIEEIATPDP